MSRRESRTRHGAAPVLLAAGAALLAAAVAGAAERTLAFDASRTEVSFDLPATGHDVHGLIALKHGEIRFDDESGAASGEIVLDSASAKSGNGSRDETIRDDVFEAAKFPEIRFVAERMEGRLAEEGASEIRLLGKVRIHGTEHPLTMKARAITHGGRLTVETEFPVAFIDWGMKDPSIMFLRVEPVVTVKVRAEGALAPATATSAIGGGGV